MRDYSKVSPQFWIGKTGKELKKKGTDAVIVALHLLTSSHANMLGMYYVPLIYIVHETGLSLEAANKGLQACIEVGFCDYDLDAEVVWVYEMARHQIASALKRDDKRCTGVQNEYNDQPESKHLHGFYQKYALAFHMTSCRPQQAPDKSLGMPLGKPEDKPLASQEQEQDQEQKQGQEQEQEQTHVVPQHAAADVISSPSHHADGDASPATEPDPAQEIFEFWKKVMASPKSVMDDKRRKLIKAALQHYSPRDLCQAIRGCSKSPFNMGDNDRRTRYNGLDLILRSAEKIDAFMAMDNGAARATTTTDTLEQRNQRAMAELLGDTSIVINDATITLHNDDGTTIHRETHHHASH